MVWNIASLLEETINKNSVSICSHDVRKAVASPLMSVLFVKGGNYLVNCLREFMPGIKKHSLCGRFFY